MHFTRRVRVLFGGMASVVLAFLYLPLAIIVVLSFNTVSSLSWPPKGFTLHWWQSALHSSGARNACW
jgi:putative spermidine/putrescine transport system permease protein